MLKRIPSYLLKVLNISKTNSPVVFHSPVVTAPTEKDDGENQRDNDKYTRRPKNALISKMLTPDANVISAKPFEKMAPNAPCNTPIIWMDLEMTGLDITKDVIMEIGCIITGPNLDEVARLPELILNVPGTLLDSMDAWCTSHHGDSGLTEACRNSTLTTSEAENTLLTFLQQHTEAGVCPLGGNSLTYDRIFLQKFMPLAYYHIHYRSIDVSTVKELVRRWYPKEYNDLPEKRYIHKTIADLEDSINELKYYRSKTFRQPAPTAPTSTSDSEEST